MSNLQTVLDSILGIYNYTLAPTRIGVASLDFAYLMRCAVLLMTLYFIFSFMRSILNLLKWGVKV